MEKEVKVLKSSFQYYFQTTHMGTIFFLQHARKIAVDIDNTPI